MFGVKRNHVIRKRRCKTANVRSNPKEFIEKSRNNSIGTNTMYELIKRVEELTLEQKYHSKKKLTLKYPYMN